MKLKHLFAFAFLFFIHYSVFAQDCSIMYSGKFIDIEDSDKTAYIEINGIWFYDYSNDNKNFIRSRIDWSSDCTYTLTLAETNMENLGVPIGTKLKVEILDVNGDEITYQYLPAGVLEPRVLKKVGEVEQ